MGWTTTLRDAWELRAGDMVQQVGAGGMVLAMQVTGVQQFPDVGTVRVMLDSGTAVVLRQAEQVPVMDFEVDRGVM